MSLGPQGACALLTALSLDSPFNTAKRPVDTLVVYIFSNTDPEYANNLRFFLKHGVAEGDGCEYVVVIQTGEGSKALDPLPPAPANVRFEYHPNSCYDWGTFGWLLDTGKIQPAGYKYFIFMNSSVRGPFIPPYLQGKVRWQATLTSKLSDTVKLVGPTISCEGSPKDGIVDGEWRTNPHVQSYVVATDQVGFGIMYRNGNVFKCHTDMWDTIFHAELGSSWTVLQAGYNIDSFMMRYQGIDWLDKRNWECNNRQVLLVNPYGEHYYDGISLNPFEVLFVKTKGVLLGNDWSYSTLATKYDQWMAAQASGVPDVTSNEWSTRSQDFKAPKIATMRYRGPKCFDFAFYQAKSKDLQGLQSQDQLWEHFVSMGQFEGRNFRKDWLAGAVSRTATAPIDRLKMLLQIQDGAQGLTLRGGLQKIAAEGTLRAYFRGNGINVLKIAPETGLKFTFNDRIKQMLLGEHIDRITPAQRMMCGGLAGATAQATIYPLELVRTRLAVSPEGTYRGMRDCVRKVLQHEGVRAFYKGLLPSLIGIIPYAGVDIATFELMKQHLLEKYHGDPHPVSILAAGMLSSSVAQFASYPLSLVRTRLQAQGIGGKPMKYKGMTDVLSRTYRNEGMRGLYRGLLPNMLKLAPSAGISWFVFEEAKRQLGLKVQI
eukprot:jgi/Astpho2/6722/Aster-06741